MNTSNEVCWNTYAKTYDMLLGYNPFYQCVREDVMREVRKWNINEGDIIADIGAGTGNYSLTIAEEFPEANILHIDNDYGMNLQTIIKRDAVGITNHTIIDKDIEHVNFNSGQLKALVSIHALYTFPQPERVIKYMYEWLEPGGQAVLVNAGRILNILDWQLALCWHLLKNHGLNKTIQILKMGKEVSRQNAFIRDMQRKGEFWTHSHEEFCQAIMEAGFIISKSYVTFRGVSDFALVRKPF